MSDLDTFPTDAARSVSGLQTVFVVICLEPDGKEVRHIFSSREVCDAFCAKDGRTHIIYDYVLDCPERHEGMTQ